MDLTRCTRCFVIVEPKQQPLRSSLSNLSSFQIIAGKLLIFWYIQRNIAKSYLRRWSRRFFCVKIYCCIVAFDPAKNAIPRWCTGRKWHIPMASNRMRSLGRIKADNMGQGEGPTVPLQIDAPEESDLWTARQLFPLDDDQTCDFKDRVGDRVGVELLYNSVKTQFEWQFQ